MKRLIILTLIIGLCASVTPAAIYLTASAQVAPTVPPARLVAMGQVTASESPPCLLLDSGAINCWGDESYSQVGNGTRINHLTPALTLGLAQSAKLTITKKVVGQAPDGDWQFSGSGSIGAFTLPAAGGNMTFSLETDTYRVTERTNSNYTASASCTNGAAVSGGSIDVTLIPGVDIDCTFTNTIQPATLIITKTLVGQPPTSDWSYIGTDPLGAFTINRNGGSRAFSDLPPATYSIAETTKPGYDVLVACSNQQNGVDSVSLTLSSGDTVACEFTNTGQAAISLEKTVGLDPNTCATTDLIAVDTGTTVYYCYTVQNTGNIMLTRHDLDDSKLGGVLKDYRYDLEPGATLNTVTAGFVIPDTINTTTINDATWTASFDGELPAFASDTAAVNASRAISLAKTVGVAGETPTCPTTDDITVAAGTTVEYCYTVWNTGVLTLSSHSLVDDQLGTLLTDSAGELAPGASLSTLDLGKVITATIATTTRNVATWTASNAGTVPPAIASNIEADPVVAVSAAIVNVPPSFVPGLFLPVIIR